MLGCFLVLVESTTSTRSRQDCLWNRAYSSVARQLIQTKSTSEKEKRDVEKLGGHLKRTITSFAEDSSRIPLKAFGETFLSSTLNNSGSVGALPANSQVQLMPCSIHLFSNNGKAHQ